MSRLDEEVELVRTEYPDLEFDSATLWARIPSHSVPSALWERDEVEVAFQFPAQLPGQAPYGFWVRPGLVSTSGAAVTNYTYPVSTPFGEGFGQFSWAPETWTPKTQLGSGSNMLDFVRSFARRLAEGA